jgi:FkbM family methyltransferase
MKFIFEKFNGILFKIKLLRYNQYRIAEAKSIAAERGAVFGQHFEDRVVEIVLGKVNSFVDIGANDGITLSNTYYFAEHGATGLCFEPGNNAFKFLQKVHKKNRKVFCINEAVTKIEQKVVLHEGGYGGLLSTLTPSAKSGFVSKLQPIMGRPLAHWVKIYPEFRSVDLLSVDVEGEERSVLESIDFEEFAAKLIIVEIDNPDLNEVRQVHSILVENGYRLFARNPFNCFYAGAKTAIDDKILGEIQNLSGDFVIFMDCSEATSES